MNHLEGRHKHFVWEAALRSGHTIQTLATLWGLAEKAEWQTLATAHKTTSATTQAAAREVAQACPDGVDTLINNAGTLGSYDLASETCARLPSVHMLHMLLACLRRSAGGALLAVLLGSLSWTAEEAHASLGHCSRCMRAGDCMHAQGCLTLSPRPAAEPWAGLAQDV